MMLFQRSNDLRHSSFTPWNEALQPSISISPSQWRLRNIVSLGSKHILPSPCPCLHCVEYDDLSRPVAQRYDVLPTYRFFHVLITLWNPEESCVAINNAVVANTKAWLRILRRWSCIRYLYIEVDGPSVTRQVSSILRQGNVANRDSNKSL